MKNTIVGMIDDNTNTPHQSDRVGRVGSANAVVIHNIGVRGCLNESDYELLALIKGEKESKDFSSASMKLGVQIEDMTFEALKYKYPNATSNPYYESQKLSKKYGFRIGSHIDYEVDDKCIWLENKAVIGDTDDVRRNYDTQLAWHWMLMTEKYGNKGRLLLSHYDTEHWADTFDPMRLNVIPVFDNPSGVAYANSIVKNIKKGLQIIKDALPTFEYKPKSELVTTKDAMPLAVQEKLVRIKEMMQYVKEYETLLAEFKDGIFSSAHEKGIKSIDLMDLGIKFTIVPPTTQMLFNSKALKESHPRIYSRHLKQSERKGYLKVKLTDKNEITD